MKKKKPAGEAVSERQAVAATKVLSAYLHDKATRAEATAARKVISAHIRQREAAVRAEAKRLGANGGASAVLRKILEEEK